MAEQTEGNRDPERLRFGAALMLVITYGITVGGLLLPIGRPPNLIGRELLEEETGEPLTFAEWFLMALPIVLVMFVAVIVIVLFNRPEVSRSTAWRSTWPRSAASSAGSPRREEHPLRAGVRAGRLVPARPRRVVAGDDSTPTRR